MPKGIPVTILGGLPVIADVSFGTDDSPVFGREDWAEVDALYWMKRDGTAGKPIPQKVWDRAEKADPGLVSVTEQAIDWLAYKDVQPDAEPEVFQFFVAEVPHA